MELDEKIDALMAITGFLISAHARERSIPLSELEQSIVQAIRREGPITEQAASYVNAVDKYFRQI